MVPSLPMPHLSSQISIPKPLNSLKGLCRKNPAQVYLFLNLPQIQEQLELLGTLAIIQSSIHILFW